MWTQRRTYKPSVVLPLGGGASLSVHLPSGAAGSDEGLPSARNLLPSLAPSSLPKVPTDEMPAYDVLVVEDDASIREQLAETVRIEGYSALTAADGKEALELVRTCRVGVVILDLMMPVMGGREFVAAVRNDPEQAGLPVLVITAVSNAHRAVGGPVFLKPLNVDSLLRAVRAHLGPRH